VRVRVRLCQSFRLGDQCLWRTWPVHPLPPPKLDGDTYLLENLPLQWDSDRDLNGDGVACMGFDIYSSVNQGLLCCGGNFTFAPKKRLPIRGRRSARAIIGNWRSVNIIYFHLKNTRSA
jgi:hypothetical protein